VRAECNYKIGIERKVGEKLSEMAQRLISSVTFYASMKHYRAVVGLTAEEDAIKAHRKFSPLDNLHVK